MIALLKINNMFALLIKKLIAVILAILIFGCSEKNMNKMGLRKEQADAYSISRKNPLIMPPDMTLRPPKEEGVYDNKIGKNKISDSDKISDISIDEILIGSNKKIKSKTKNNKYSRDLVTSILKAKIDAILK